MTDAETKDPAESCPLVCAMWDAINDLRKAVDDIVGEFRRRFPAGATMTDGVHKSCGESVKLAGAEVDSVTWSLDPDWSGPFSGSSSNMPCLRLLLPRSSVYAGDSRVLTLTYVELVRAGAK